LVEYIRWCIKRKQESFGIRAFFFFFDKPPNNSSVEPQKDCLYLARPNQPGIEGHLPETQNIWSRQHIAEINA
jgi:hypothetical protein